jgi:hypothetical protein
MSLEQMPRYWVSCTDALEDWLDFERTDEVLHELRGFLAQVHASMRHVSALETPTLTFTSAGSLVFTAIVHAESQADAVVLAKHGFDLAWQTVGGECDLPDEGAAWRIHNLKDTLKDARTTVVSLSRAA